MNTSVRLGYARVFVQVRAVPPLDWEGLLDASVQHREAIIQYAAAALRHGRGSVLLRAERGGILPDDAPPACPHELAHAPKPR